MPGLCVCVNKFALHLMNLTMWDTRVLSDGHLVQIFDFTIYQTRLLADIFLSILRIELSLILHLIKFIAESTENKNSIS